MARICHRLDGRVHSVVDCDQKSVDLLGEGNHPWLIGTNLALGWNSVAEIRPRANRMCAATAFEGGREWHRHCGAFLCLDGSDTNGEREHASRNGGRSRNRSQPSATTLATKSPHGPAPQLRFS